MNYGLSIIILLILCGCERNESYIIQSNAKSVVKILTLKCEGVMGRISREQENKVRTIECCYNNLSDVFDFRINYLTIPGKTDNDEDSSATAISVISKKSGKMVDSVFFKSWTIFDALFLDCKQGYSYSPGKNAIPEVRDNFFGDLVIADFNFDGREDFAVISDIGGNGGPIYRYYLQDRSMKFRLDQFLTDSMRYFPVEFDKKQKTLLTSVHANVYSDARTIYKYNSRTRKWKSIKDGFLIFEDGKPKIVEDI